MTTVYCWTPLLIMFQYWALWVPENCKNELLCCWLAFDLFPDSWLWIFPLHTMLFTLQLIMVDPCFVTSDDSVQEGATCFFIATQILLADVQACLFMQHCELFWDPSCTNFMKAKSIVDDFICRTMTNLQTICHFINSQSSNRTISRMCSTLSWVVAVNGRPSAFSCVTLVWPFLNFFIYSYTHCWGKTSFLYCAESLWRISAPDNLQTTKKNRSLNAALPWCKKKMEWPWLTLRLRQRNWRSNFKPAQLW